ncbi:MAG: selenide, water dikinase SelD [Bacteroidales bacterium]|nr:selenide, water dikinase SelD [Bacteroidales bacterium]
MQPIYLDHNATTPIAREVADAMRPYLEQYFGNPSSTHSFGTSTKKAVEKSRGQVAHLINCESSEVIFTSGGTESNNYALKGAAYALGKKGNHIITSSIEHPAVFEVCRYLEKQGFEVTYLPVDEFGMVDPNDVNKSIRDETILISIMHANNEVGTIQPISEISAIARKHNIIFHADAAQSLGKIETDVKDLGVDLLSIAGHKLYAPKGIGALYIRSGVQLEKLIHGADHEQNLRAGTENVLEIVGLGVACELAEKELKNNQAHYMETRDYLYQLISESLPSVKLNGHPEKRLPNTLSISFPNVEANTLVSRLEGVAVSAGAACHSESIDVSAVLEAMKLPIEYAMGTVRFSTGRTNTMNEIKQAAEEVIATASVLMPDAPVSNQKEKVDSKNIRLTQYTHGLGCACKIEPLQLEQILASLPTFTDQNVLVGTETADDATVYRISDDFALVMSLDFFTPIVDDPYAFGAIAAANAMSDIYAMGANPLFAMNIVGFPENTLPMSVLEQILKGAHDKAAEAGISVQGGHTIEDPEPKYGMVVSGGIHPDKIIRNVGALPGDQLILTKPLGTGILSTAMKRGLIDHELQLEVITLMSSLNRTAAETMIKYNVHACTDITGFGLMGHLFEMSRGSKCDAELVFNQVPFIREVRSLATAGVIPGGSFNNHAYTKDHTEYGILGRTLQLMLCDAQTSGGLLIALPGEESENCLDELRTAGLTDAAIIGNFKCKGSGVITVRS